MTAIDYNVKIDQELQAEAFAVLEGYGLSPSQAIKLFFKQIARTKIVPLSLDYQAKELTHEFIPNLETQQDILQARQDFLAGKLESYQTIEEAMQAIKETAHG